MNILVVAHYHYQGICVPTALFVHEQMRAFVRMGHRVRIIVPIPYGKKNDAGRRFGPAVWQETVDGIEHVYLRHISFSNYGKRSLNTQCALAAMRSNMERLLDNFKPDIIHAHKLGTNTELGSLLQQHTGCPLVFTSHGETGCEEPWIHDLNAIKAHADKANTVICVSSAICRTLDKAGVSTPHRVILNGFAVDQIPSHSEKISLSLIQVGHLTKQKQVHVTVDAFRKLRNRYSQATLARMGDGPERNALEDQSASYGLMESVRFTGQVQNADVLAVMGQSQFFVMPSVHEGFGIVYLEAMASGCITIGTEGEGIADLIVHGKNGFLVPPDNPDAIVEIIEWCINHPNEAAAIAEQGRQDARALTWDKNAAQYIALFKSLLER